VSHVYTLIKAHDLVRFHPPNRMRNYAVRCRKHSAAYHSKHNIVQQPALVLQGLAIRNNGDTIFVTSYGDRAVRRLNRDGTLIVSLSVSGQPFGVRTDSVGDVYVASTTPQTRRQQRTDHCKLQQPLLQGRINRCRHRLHLRCEL